MGKLIDGQWHKAGMDTSATDGKFIRNDASFRNWVTNDGTSPFPAESGRYHLYVSLACPWAHRALIFRKLKHLEQHIDVSIVDPLMLDDGWVFNDKWPDHLDGRAMLREIYVQANPKYTGRVTVPVLWDKKTSVIVSNESSEIIRMFNSAFSAFETGGTDLYPEALRAEIDELNARIYDTVNNGVYKAGFAATQAAYEDAVEALFTTLDELEERLEGKRYLLGDVQTEADWRLFTTLIRFDPVYVGHFKCNRRQICQYPNLWAYTRRLYNVPGVSETVDIEHIKRHYYGSHLNINPTGIVPVGPTLDYSAPSD